MQDTTAWRYKQWPGLTQNMLNNTMTKCDCVCAISTYFHVFGNFDYSLLLMCFRVACIGIARYLLTIQLVLVCVSNYDMYWSSDTEICMQNVSTTNSGICRATNSILFCTPVLKLPRWIMSRERRLL